MDDIARPAAARQAELEDDQDFIRRHIGPSEAEIDSMLVSLGQPSLAALVDAIVPDSIRLKTPLALDPPVGEAPALARLSELAARNRIFATTSAWATTRPGCRR